MLLNIPHCRAPPPPPSKNCYFPNGNSSEVEKSCLRTEVRFFFTVKCCIVNLLDLASHKVSGITSNSTEQPQKLQNLSPKVAESSIISILRIHIQVSNHTVSGYQEILAYLKSSITFSLRNLKSFYIGEVKYIHTFIRRITWCKDYSIYKSGLSVERLQQ